MSNHVGRELDWEDEISNDSPEFTVLPAGDYDFTVVDVERDRHKGSEKLPACNMAVVHIRIEKDGEVATIRHRLFLHTKTEGMLCSFFKSIGHRQTGEKLNMNWQKAKGATGRAKVAVRPYEGKEYNEIKAFYEKAAKPKYTPGKFDYGHYAAPIPT